jgi:hypothetical protein
MSAVLKRFRSSGRPQMRARSEPHRLHIQNLRLSRICSVAEEKAPLSAASVDAVE